MKHTMLLIALLLCIAASSQTIVPDPLGDIRCSCAELVAVRVPWLEQTTEVAYICTQVTNWNLDTVALGSYFFEVRNYRADSSVYYTRMSTADLPNGGNYRIGGINKSADLNTMILYILNYLAVGLGLRIAYK